MKIVLGILGVLVGGVLLVTLAGFFIPRNHRVSSRIQLQQFPQTVFGLIQDLEHADAWWPELRSVTRLPELNGHERWRQETSMGPIGLIVMEAHPPVSLRTVIDTTGGSPFGGEWQYEITPTVDGCQLTITETGWVSNPLFRTISRVMGYYGTMDSYLTALSRHFKEKRLPEHVAPAE